MTTQYSSNRGQGKTISKVRGGTRPMAMASIAQRQRRQGQRAEGKSHYTITAMADQPGHAEIFLYGAVGEDWWGDGNSAIDFARQLKDLGPLTNITLRINSGGGDVFDGTAIYNTLVKHDAHLRVEIEGVAASAATLIAMAGDEIHMAENAFFMIHAASGGCWGNAREMREYLELLDMADDLLLLTYERRTGLEEDELKGMLAKDTWLKADKALELGFITAIDEAKDVVPDMTPDNANDKQPVARLRLDDVGRARNILHTLSAHVRGAVPNASPLPPEETEMKLTAKLRARCVAAGMDANLSDNDAAEWYEINEDKVLATAAATTTTAPAPQPAPAAANPAPAQPATQPAAAPVQQTVPMGAGTDGEQTLTVSMLANFFDEREKRAKAQRQEREQRVDGLLKLAFDTDVPTGLRAELLNLEEETAIHARIQDAKATAQQRVPSGPQIGFPSEQPRDRHLKALSTSLSMRALNRAANGDGQKIERALPEASRPKDWTNFQNMPLIDLARECLKAEGMSDTQVRNLNVTQVAQLAMGFGANMGLTNFAGGLNTIGSLNLITQDAVNKTLLMGYNEAPSTWRGPGRQADSTSDFKEIHRIKLGSAPEMDDWASGTAPNEVKLSNEEETYAVEAKAATITFDWQMVLSNNLDAISRRPQVMGDAAKRTINARFWNILIRNGVMSDGQPLSLASPTGRRKQSNHIASGNGGAPSITQLGKMRELLRKMKGLNTPEGEESDDLLSIEARYLVVGSKHETIAEQLIRSTADPSLQHQGTYNFARSLVPVVEPRLDVINSGNAYFMFTDPARVDTLEVTFLEGQETPVTHSWMDNRTMAQCYTVIQTFGVKAIDWRGIVRNDGD